MESDSLLIRVEDVDFGYEEGKPVLAGASLDLRKGEKIGLTGSIGSGKTTLLHLIVGLLRPARGSISAFGRPRKKERDFWEVRERAGLLFQDPEDQLFCPTVLEDTAFGPLNQGKPREEVYEIVRETLDMLGLGGFEERITHHLSGGEKRLVSLAAVLAMKPDVLLLDEPLAGLDLPSSVRIRDLLEMLPQAMLIVSHDASLIDSVATGSVRIESGCIRPI